MLKKIGRYIIEAEIGVGAFGRVYRAIDPNIKHTVAIKVLISIEDPDTLQRFREEAGTTARLAHSNIVTVHAFDEENGTPYLVMEYLEGRTLRDVIAEKQPLKLLEKVEIMYQVAEGLRYAHSKGVIHRDMKPGNIMVAPNGSVKIMDFGIARLAEFDSTLKSRQGDFAGTIPYMAPEQFRGYGTTRFGDIFSYGVIFYELIGGVQPFEAKDPGSVMYLITTHDPPPLRDSHPEIPEALDNLIQRLIAKERELRVDQMEEVLLDAQPIRQQLRQARAAELGAGIAALIDAGDTDQAQKLLMRVLELDPLHREARTWKDHLGAQSRRALLRSRVETLVQGSNEHLQKRQFSEAITSLEAALNLEKTNEELHRLLDVAKTRLNNARASTRFLAESKWELQQQRPEKALEVANRVGALDPGNPDVGPLLDTIQKELSQRKIADVMRRAEDLLGLGSFDEGLLIIDELGSEVKDLPQLQTLRSRISVEKLEAERRERHSVFLAGLDKAREAMEKLQFVEAEDVAQQLCADFPEEPAASVLLAEIHMRRAEQLRIRAVSEIAESVRAFIRDKQIEAARGALKTGMQEFPNESSLRRLDDMLVALEAAYHRTEAIRRVEREAEDHRKADRFDQAIGVVKKALAEMGIDPVLVALQKDLEFEREQRETSRMIELRLKEAVELLDTGQLHAAVQILEPLSKQHPREERLVGMLEAANSAVLEEQESLNRLLADIAALESRDEFAGALKHAKLARPSCEGHQVLAATVERLQSRQAELDNNLLEIRAAIRAANFHEASAALQRAQSKFPYAAALTPLVQTISEGVANAEWHALETNVRDRIQAGDIRLAANQLVAADVDQHKSELWRQLWNEWEKRLRNREAEIEDSIQLLEWLAQRGIAGPKHERTLAAAREALRTARLKSDSNNIEKAISVGDWARSTQLLKAAQAEFPNEPLFAEFEARISKGQAEFEATMRRLEIEGFIRRNDFKVAIERLAASREGLANSPAWPLLWTNIEARLTAPDRCDAAATLLKELPSQSRELTEVQRLIAAVSKANEHQTHERERVLEMERQAIAAARQREEEAKRKQEEIEKGRAAAAARLKAGDLAAALKLIDELNARHPGEASVLADRDAINQAIAAARQREEEVKRKQEEIEKGRAAAAARLKAGDLAAALKLIDELNALHPGEASVLADRDAIIQKQIRERQDYEKRSEMARLAEGADRPEEALQHWNLLRERHPNDSEVKAAIARAMTLIADKRRRVLDAAVASAKGAMDDGHLEEASQQLKLISSMLDAIPNRSAALSAVVSGLQSRLANLLAAKRLIEEGERLFARSDFKGGSQKFRDAAKRIPSEGEVLAAYVNTLIQQATMIADNDWKGTEHLIEVISLLDPRHSAVIELRSRANAARLEEAVVGVLKNSEKLISTGSLERARKTVEEGLAAYPGEPRLTQRLAAIDSQLIQTIQSKEQKINLKELEKIESELSSAKPRHIAKLVERLAKIEARAVPGSEAAIKARRIAQSAAARAQTILASTTDADETATDVTRPAPPSSKSAVLKNIDRRKLMIGAAAAVLLAIGILVSVRFLRPAKAIEVTVTSEAAGVAVSLANQTCVIPACQIHVPAGTYTLTARKDGYRLLTQQVTIRAGQTLLSLPVTLEPLPELLNISTNFDSGRITLDGSPAGDLRDGQFSLSGIKPGRHVLKITSGVASFETAWISKLGSGPEIVSPVSAANLQATVVASVGETGAVLCNCGGQNVSVDGVAVGRAGASAGDATIFKNLKEGRRQIAVAGRTSVVDVHPNPALSLFLTMDRNVGTLIVETGEDNAKIYLNNQLYRRTSEHGALRITVDVGQYSIRVEKDGFQRPPVQIISVGKGDERRVAMALVPTTSSLYIVGAMPATQVRIDGNTIGETDAAGAFRAAVQPGTHNIDLVKPGYVTARLVAQFTAGSAFRPEPEQLAMSRIGPPPPPNPVQIEAQDWDRIRGSNNAGDFEAFLNRHSNGAHAAEARNRENQLRQQQQANAARQAEQTVWDATDKSRKASLQDFLSRFGNGAHAQDARTLISGFDKQEADALASRRAKELQDKERRDREQEAATRGAADEQAVARTIGSFETSFNGMDLRGLQAIWVDIPKATADALDNQFRAARAVTYQLTPLGRATINGTSATVNCSRSLTVVLKSGQRVPPAQDMVRVALERAGNRWVIRSLTPY